MRIGKFQPPQNRYPWTDQQKSRHSWLCPREDPYTKFGTNPPTEGFWANGWNIPKKYFLFIPFFSGSRTGQTRGWIFTRDSSKDVKSRKDLPFGGLNDVPLNFGRKTPKNWTFGGVNKTLKPERQKIQIPITWKLLSRSQRNFYREYAPCTNTPSRAVPWLSPTNPRWRRPLSLFSGKCK